MKRWFFIALAVALGGLAWLSITALHLERDEAEARGRAAQEESVRLALWRMDSALAPFLVREGARTPAQMGAPPRHVRLYFLRGPDGHVSSPQPDKRLPQLEALLSKLPNAAATAPAVTPEYVARQKNIEAQQANVARPPDRPEWTAMRPIFVGNELVLVRDDDGGVIGAWLDWPGIQTWLVGEVRDLLPKARLEPAPGAVRTERLLASLPARLVPGDAPPTPARGLGVIWILGLAWAGLVVGGIAVGALLFGAMALSERRAAFVSAVTHELRTPLTTFRTYTEMLAEGMVEPEKRQTYLDTLAREAERLAHLVENVLAYARLEKQPIAPLTEEVTLADLFERVRPRLVERVHSAGMTIAWGEPPATRVRVDVSAVEQILFNLVDNACKYAAAADDKRIHIDARATDKVVTISVGDHGPGIQRGERKRVFRPFERSAERAAGSAPGVGLGLALCRRLARAMGGDLNIGRHSGGAVLQFTLPRAGA